MKIKDQYHNGECPDCGEYIPDDAYEGGQCECCGHVWFNYTEGGEDNEQSQ